MQVLVLSGLAQPLHQTTVWVSPSTKKELFDRKHGSPASGRPFLLLSILETEDDSAIQATRQSHSLVVQLRSKAGIPDHTCAVSDSCISAAGLSSHYSMAWLDRCLSMTAAVHTDPHGLQLPGLRASLQVLLSAPSQPSQSIRSRLLYPVPLLLAPAALGGTSPGLLAPAPATHATLHQLPHVPGTAAPSTEDVASALSQFFDKPRLLLAGQLLSLPLAGAAEGPLATPAWASDEDALLLPPPSILALPHYQCPPHVRFRVGALHCAEGLEVHTWLPAGVQTAAPPAQAATAATDPPIQDALYVAAAFVGASFTQLALSLAAAPVPMATHAAWVQPQPLMPKAALLTCRPGAVQELVTRLRSQQFSAVCAPHGGGKRVVVAAAAAAALPCAEVHAADVLRAAQGGAHSSKAIIARVADTLDTLQGAAVARFGPCVLHLRCAHLLLLAAAAENTHLTQRLGQEQLLSQDAAGASSSADAHASAASVVRRWLSRAASAPLAPLALSAAGQPQHAPQHTPEKHSTHDDWVYFSKHDLMEVGSHGPTSASSAAVHHTTTLCSAATWVVSAAHPAIFEHWETDDPYILNTRCDDPTHVTAVEGVRCLLLAWAGKFGSGDPPSPPLSSAEQRMLCSLTAAQLDDCCISAWGAHVQAGGGTHGGLQAWSRGVLAHAGGLTPLPQRLQDGAVDESEHSHFATLPGWRMAAPGIFGDSAAAVQRTSWADVGGADSAKAELHRLVTLPLAAAKRRKAQGHPRRAVLRMSGILLFGPPGTGKTLLAKAVAHECGVAFHSVKGPELLDKYIGESEGNVRRVFESARAAAPCVVFFDELDALAPARGTGADSGGVSDRVVSALLAEIDACSKSPQPVFVLGATNRPDLLDGALLRPGRFDRRVYVGPLTTPPAQLEVLQAQLAHMQLHADVTAEAVQALLPPVCTGADIRGLLSRAGTQALRRRALQLETALRSHTGTEAGGHPSNAQAWAYAAALPAEEATPAATLRDFQAAAAGLLCSVSPADLARYEGMRDSMASGAM